MRPAMSSATKPTRAMLVGHPLDDDSALGASDIFDIGAYGVDGGFANSPLETPAAGLGSGPDTPDVIVEESSSSSSLPGGSSSGSGDSTVAAGAASSGLVINVSYDGSVNKAPAGFKTVVGQVAQYLQSHFPDPITVN